jgi:pyruvate formate lyase activating enzyme
VAACPIAAVARENDKTVTNRSLCDCCGLCAKACPSSAREITGYEMDAAEAADKACADKLFFTDSGGGITLSGGEVLSQPEFAVEILCRCKEKGVHTAIETCGFAKFDRLATVLEYVDLVLYDFKHMDSETHKRLTGVDNRLILENAKRIVHELGKDLIGRVPLIPGHNDDLENIVATARFIAAELGRNIKVHLLPYNPLGESKNGSLEQAELLILKRQSDEYLESLRSAAAAYLDEAVVGG